MAAPAGTIVYSHPSPGILTQWHVRLGDNVEEGALVAEFEGKHDHACIILHPPCHLFRF